MSKNVTGTIREKKGLYYAVINYYGENEERKQKWFPTKLPVRGNKKKAEAILKQVLCEFEIPISKGEKVNLCVNQKIQIENTGDAAVVNVKSVISTKAAEDMSLDDFPKDQVQFLLFSDYLKKYVPLTLKRKKKIEATTYSAYVGNINNPIAPYFEEKGITLGELTAEDIQDFYDVQLERVTANTVIHYHAIIRHTCASLLLNKGKHDGITLKDIQVWLGHSDFSTTANTYSHLDATSKVSSLTALSGAVSLADC